MIAFFLPHKLLSHADLYKAALCRDPQQAISAFSRWAKDKSPEDISYYDHKPICFAWTRHSSEFNNHTLAGTFDNIHRQAWLRTNTNSQLLENLVISMGETRAIALGEVYAHWFLDSKHLDHFDLGVGCDDLNAACASAQKLGFLLQSPQYKPRFRSVYLANLRHSGKKLSLRIFGFENQPNNLERIQAVNNLFTFSCHEYRVFSESNLFGLLRRRDQFIFDAAAKLKRPGQFKKEDILHSVNWFVRETARECLGVKSTNSAVLTSVRSRNR